MTTSERIPTSDLDGSLLAFARLEERRGPTVREYAHEIGINSTNSATNRLGLLLRHGLIEVVSARGDTRMYRLSAAGLAKVQEMTEGAQ